MNALVNTLQKKLNFLSLRNRYRLTHNLTKMTTFQVLSDFHLDLRDDIPEIKKTSENLILGGDIGYLTSPNFLNFLKYVNSNWSNIFIVLGNHEFHTKNSRHLTKSELELCYEELFRSYSNIHFLNRSSHKIVCSDSSIVELFGCTLWSKPTIGDYLTDFKKIHVYDFIKKYRRPVTLSEFHKFHQIDSEWLEKALEESSSEKKIVVTHFLPMENSLIPNTPYKKSDYDTYYSTNMSHLMKKANVWISGHTHFSFDFNVDFNSDLNPKVKSTRWISNAFCYRGEKSNYNENLQLVI